MARGSAVRNRSDPVSISTPRGQIEVVRQEMKGVRRNSGWTWFWVARRSGQQLWCEASTAREAIQRAALLPPRQRTVWLEEAAAERQILAGARAAARSR